MFDQSTIPTIAASLHAGGVVVLPTDTIYGIVGQALNRDAVQSIYHLKQRTPSKPFIILISDIKDVRQFGVALNETLRTQLQEFWPGPVSIILDCPNPEMEYLHRGTNSLAFRLPAHDTLRQLINQTGPLVAPSANPEGLEPAKDTAEAQAYFPEGVAGFYAGPTSDKPSKIIRITGGQVEVIRP